MLVINFTKFILYFHELLVEPLRLFSAGFRASGWGESQGGAKSRASGPGSLAWGRPETGGHTGTRVTEVGARPRRKSPRCHTCGFPAPVAPCL